MTPRDRRLQRAHDDLDSAGFGAAGSVSETAEILGVSPKTIRRRVRSGQLVAYRTSPSRTGKLRISRNSLAEWMAQMLTFARAGREAGPAKRGEDGRYSPSEEGGDDAAP